MFQDLVIEISMKTTIEIVSITRRDTYIHHFYGYVQSIFHRDLPFGKHAKKTMVNHHFELGRLTLSMATFSSIDKKYLGWTPI